MITERCRECQGGLFGRRAVGNSPNRERVVTRYPPDGSLRAGETIYCLRCETPHRVGYDAEAHEWRLKQSGPVGRQFGRPSTPRSRFV